MDFSQIGWKRKPSFRDGLKRFQSLYHKTPEILEIIIIVVEGIGWKTFLWKRDKTRTRVDFQLSKEWEALPAAVVAAFSSSSNKETSWGQLIIWRLRRAGRQCSSVTTFCHNVFKEVSEFIWLDATFASSTSSANAWITKRSHGRLGHGTASMDMVVIDGRTRFGTSSSNLGHFSISEFLDRADR
ncbi:hypothetical protein Acr_14g0003760 [Actinidia rufa]|uniref:Uncharacterized protein n=1 Tax=Actinidia rufa TaxID=165716 RepID=A0A7J0FQ18_9ERIC|nr:hypothetical protein Acr_14g0003760 [Actinidia rufa]